jgi:YgiT-type zinc finger domain-containing protein
VTIDRDTDDIVFENMPGTGCPACGERIFRDYRLVVERSDAA